MSSTITERQRINTSSAVKVPCKAATTANITLSGEQTVDGVACVTNNRVLVKNQTDTTENGIYIVNTSSWSRARDWDGAFDVKQGTFVYVTGGTNSGFWYVTTSTDPIIPGTTSVTIAQASSQLLTFSAFMQTLFDDADAAGFLTTLGVSAYIQTLLNDADAATARTTLGAVGLTGNEAVAGDKTLSGTLAMSSKPINEAKGADIASATTTDIGAATGNFVDVTGTVTITSLGTSQAGVRRVVRFTGALILTHNSVSLILPGAANITTVANDTAEFISLGSGNWVCTEYQRYSGYSSGTQAFTASGSWTAPAGVTSAKVLLISGGGGGGGGVNNAGRGGGGGGAGGSYLTQHTVVPGTSYTVTIGAAGTAGAANGGAGGNGGATEFDAISVSGGIGGGATGGASFNSSTAGAAGSGTATAGTQGGGVLGAGGQPGAGGGTGGGGGGAGGSSIFGKGGNGGAGGAGGIGGGAGTAGTYYGGGGGGGGGGGDTSAGAAGGAGTAGLVVVWW